MCPVSFSAQFLKFCMNENKELHTKKKSFVTKKPYLGNRNSRSVNSHKA
jgi:hypothetical protein